MQKWQWACEQERLMQKWQWFQWQNLLSPTVQSKHSLGTRPRFIAVGIQVQLQVHQYFQLLISPA